MSRSNWLCRVSVLFAILWAAPACGGDDDGGVTVADGGGGSTSDAGAGGGGETAEFLGQSCDDANPCPNEGEEAGCVSTTEAGPGFCTLLCTANDQCMNGYTGPGVPGCFLSLVDGSGQPAGMACGVICDAPDEMCPADVCDGKSCPGDLLCLPVPEEEGFAVCDYEGGGPGPGTPDAGVAPRRAVVKSDLVKAYRLRK